MKTFCESCNKPTKYRPPAYSGKFCNIACREEWRWVNVTKPKIFEGNVNVDSSAMRRFLVERDGYCCSSCGIVDWQGKALSLDIDHIDGDRKNNRPNNLRYLCPNCHRQTPTWGNKTRKTDD